MRLQKVGLYVWLESIWFRTWRIHSLSSNDILAFKCRIYLIRTKRIHSLASNDILHLNVIVWCWNFIFDFFRFKDPLWKIKDLAKYWNPCLLFADGLCIVSKFWIYVENVEFTVILNHYIVIRFIRTCWLIFSCLLLHLKVQWMWWKHEIGCDGILSA